jgi:hypothetical protein
MDVHELGTIESALGPADEVVSATLCRDYVIVVTKRGKVFRIDLWKDL